MLIKLSAKLKTAKYLTQRKSVTWEYSILSIAFHIAQANISAKLISNTFSCFILFLYEISEATWETDFVSSFFSLL